MTTFDRRAHMAYARSLRTTTKAGMKYVPRTEAYERLQLDGGWLTPAQLAMECDENEDNLTRTLQRQARRGWLDTRVVDLANGLAPGGTTLAGQDRKGGGNSRRTEYRARMQPASWEPEE